MLYRIANLAVRSSVALWALCQVAPGATLCVNAKPTPACSYSTIGAAVKAASPGDVIQVSNGTYHEDVVIGKAISLLGANSNNTIIDATAMPNGVFVDGIDNPGLQSVTIAGFTVQNALYEGVLVANASDVTISDNRLLNNDKYPSVFTGAATGCPGQPAYETDETGDCGGALHLTGVADSIVSGNLITGNSDGILISDDSGESHGNLIINNTVTNNPLECGIVLASHPPMGHTSPPYAAHYGVDHNTVSGNVSTNNGVKVGGSGVGLFSDGNGPGRTSENVIINNTLTGNGLGGVALHTHVGPAFGLPADNMSGNMIIGNVISRNLADLDDTKTPGRVGININSGGGGSPVVGTVITQNEISDEDVDIAINTPAVVDIHLNDLRDGSYGVANVCAYDGASICTGSINATENFWGCPQGPGGHGCSATYGTGIVFTPWLQQPIAGGLGPGLFTFWLQQLIAASPGPGLH